MARATPNTRQAGAKPAVGARVVTASEWWRSRAVDPRLEVVDVSPGWRAFLVRRRRSLSQEEQEALDTFYQELFRADILINCSAPRDVLSRAPGLKWVHILSHGLDHLHGHPLLESSIALTYSGGTDGGRLAEGAMAMVFILAAARIARACGMRVIGMRRSVTERTAGDGVAETIYPPSELPAFLAEADVLLISTPLTPETEQLIGQRELATMIDWSVQSGEIGVRPVLAKCWSKE